jgi:myosin heavy subunit
MKIKHKVIKEFQYLSPDKKIFILKLGTILNNYNYKIKDELILVDKDIIDNNPQYFQVVDWKEEIHSFIKTNKLPSPKTLANKLIPFMEDMILSSMAKSTDTGAQVDEDRLKEIESKESDLNNREKRIKSKEEELEIRSNRVEKREEDYRECLKDLDSKEDSLREKSKDLKERELDVQDKLQDINEKERNLDRTILESSKDIDIKYTELQSKIDKDLKTVTEKEKGLEITAKDIKKREDKLLDREDEIDDLLRDIERKKEEFQDWGEEVVKLDQEIKDWEKLHWKFKRLKKPPSAI